MSVSEKKLGTCTYVERNGHGGHEHFQTPFCIGWKAVASPQATRPCCQIVHFEDGPRHHIDCASHAAQPAAGTTPFRHSNGEVDFPNGDRVRWANGWWMADRKGGTTSKHRSPVEAEAALAEAEAGTTPACPTCNSQVNGIRLCLYCGTSHEVKVFSNRGCAKVECTDKWYEGTTPQAERPASDTELQ